MWITPESVLLDLSFLTDLDPVVALVFISLLFFYIILTNLFLFIYKRRKELHRHEEKMAEIHNNTLFIKKLFTPSQSPNGANLIPFEQCKGKAVETATEIAVQKCEQTAIEALTSEKKNKHKRKRANSTSSRNGVVNWKTYVRIFFQKASSFLILKKLEVFYRNSMPSWLHTIQIIVPTSRFVLSYEFMINCALLRVLFSNLPCIFLKSPYSSIKYHVPLLFHILSFYYQLFSQKLGIVPLVIGWYSIPNILFCVFIIFRT